MALPAAAPPLPMPPTVQRRAPPAVPHDDIDVVIPLGPGGDLSFLESWRSELLPCHIIAVVAAGPPGTPPPPRPVAPPGFDCDVYTRLVGGGPRRLSLNAAAPGYAAAPCKEGPPARSANPGSGAPTLIFPCRLLAPQP
jgi:hypothetical protein